MSNAERYFRETKFDIWTFRPVGQLIEFKNFYFEKDLVLEYNKIAKNNILKALFCITDF